MDKARTCWKCRIYHVVKWTTITLALGSLAITAILHVVQNPSDLYWIIAAVAAFAVIGIIATTIERYFSDCEPQNRPQDWD